MPMRKIAFPVFVALALGVATPSWAQGVDCYGSLASYRMTNPGLHCTCSSAKSMPSCSGGKSSSRGTAGTYTSPKATMRGSIAAGVIGALFEEALSSPSGPSPEEIARQNEEARQLAIQEEMRRSEEEARHKKLVGSLISVTGRTSSQTTPAKGGIRLSSLDPIDPQPRLEASEATTTESINSNPATASSLATDEEAKAWLDHPETMFKAVWKPLSVGKALPKQPQQSPACQNASTRGCEIAVKPASTIAGLNAPAKPPVSVSLPAPDKWRKTVDLLRSRSCTGTCDPFAYYLRGMGATELSQKSLTRAKIFATLDLLKESGKSTIEEAVMEVLEEYGGTPVKMMMHYRNVNTTANTVLEDAIKAAGYLGSSSLGPPPEVMPVEELAEPFVESNFALDTAKMAEKMRRIWASGQ